MTDQAPQDRQSFEAQGSAFLRQNISEKPEYDYAQNRPPHSFGLAGRSLTLSLRDEPERWSHSFTKDEVEIETLGKAGSAGRSVAPYEAFEMAPDIFFVSYRTAPEQSVAIALDLPKGVATIVRGEMTDTGIISTVKSAAIEVPGPEGGATAAAGALPYHPSASLGGTRFLNTYAHNVAYEHIYLTGVYETWLGVKGPQAGQADTEEYHAFKIADGIYLLYWNEGVLTAQMTFLFNFLAGNCVAELFARVEGDIVHNTIGANTRLIHTKLPELPDATRLDVFSGD